MEFLIGARPHLGEEGVADLVMKMIEADKKLRAGVQHILVTRTHATSIEKSGPTRSDMGFIVRLVIDWTKLMKARGIVFMSRDEEGRHQVLPPPEMIRRIGELEDIVEVVYLL